MHHELPEQSCLWIATKRNNRLLLAGVRGGVNVGFIRQFWKLTDTYFSKCSLIPKITTDMLIFHFQLLCIYVSCDHLTKVKILSCGFYFLGVGVTLISGPCFRCYCWILTLHPTKMTMTGQQETEEKLV